MYIILIKTTKTKLLYWRKPPKKGKRFLGKTIKKYENSKISKKDSNNKLERNFRKDILRNTRGE